MALSGPTIKVLRRSTTLASASEHGLYEEALERNDTAAIQKLIHPVDPEQIIGAERIAC